MTAFTVWKFDDPDGAKQAEQMLKNAESDGIVKVLDHAVVTWPVGSSQPTTTHSHEAVTRGAGWGALWGIIAGSLFLVPVVGGVAGAAIGAYSKATEGTGIGKEQLERIRVEVTEGTSALFAVTDEGDLDRLGERFTGLHSKLIATDLTADERKILLETFGN